MKRPRFELFCYRQTLRPCELPSLRFPPNQSRFENENRTSRLRNATSGPVDRTARNVFPDERNYFAAGAAAGAALGARLRGAAFFATGAGATVAAGPLAVLRALTLATSAVFASPA